MVASKYFVQSKVEDAAQDRSEAQIQSFFFGADASTTENNTSTSSSESNSPTTEGVAEGIAKGECNSPLQVCECLSFASEL